MVTPLFSSTLQQLPVDWEMDDMTIINHQSPGVQENFHLCHTLPHVGTTLPPKYRALLKDQVRLF